MVSFTTTQISLAESSKEGYSSKKAFPPMMMMMMKDEIDERIIENRRISTDETASELNITHRGDARTTRAQLKIFHSDRSRNFIKS
jgi:hypothetical protein